MHPLNALGPKRSLYARMRSEASLKKKRKKITTTTTFNRQPTTVQNTKHNDRLIDRSIECYTLARLSRDALPFHCRVLATLMALFLAVRDGVK